MPVIKSAKKKLRQDKKRQQRNKMQKDYVKEVLKKFRANPSEKLMVVAVKATDKAAKQHILPKNKAARIKSSLSKLMPRTEKQVKPVAPTKKRPTKKS
jgi:small subunit ribosomal protein S20